MNYFKLFITLLLSLSIISCSTMNSARQATNLSTLTANKAYQLRVRSGNIALDSIIHDYASMRFGTYLQLTGREPFNGYIEIVFTNDLKKGFFGSASGYAVNMQYGGSWFTGDDTAWSNIYHPSSGMEITPSGVLSWQNSSIVVIIKDLEGNSLWKARYDYKGGSELSGLYVKTADEAARISLDRIIGQFEKDFILIPKNNSVKFIPRAKII